jgi:DNA polymerase I-like protein with 3'-5' exonuclease and polymerase domains
MTEFINIQDRNTFEQFLGHMQQAKIVAADTETNGLNYYRGNRIISISVYLPEFDVSYNLPFRHGEGEVEVDYPQSEFSEITWQGKTKNQLYLRYWWGKFKSEQQGNSNITLNGTVDNYFGNLPEAWLDGVKAVWGLPDVRYIFHNARFDLHMLAQENFPIPDKVEDTMLALHLVNEDWFGNSFPNVPYKQHGKWVMNEKGEVQRKKSGRGNRQLKWQAMYWGFEDAHVGEQELEVAKEQMEREIASFIYKNWDDPYNEGLIYADILKGKSGAWDKWGEKQLDRFAGKVKLDSKSNMWMLPSDKVAYYAMLDTKLTWQLREKLIPILERWDNVELYDNVCDIQLHVAWEMERNGLQLDVEEAKNQVRIFEPRTQEVEEIVNEIAYDLHEYIVHELLDSYGNTDILKFKFLVVNQMIEEIDGYVTEHTEECLDRFDYDECMCPTQEIRREVEKVKLSVCLPHLKVKETNEKYIIDDKNDAWAVDFVDKLDYDSVSQFVSDHLIGKTVNLSSNKELPPFLRACVQVEFDLDEIIPEWMSRGDIENKAIIPREGQLYKSNKDALYNFKNHPIVQLLYEYRRMNKTVNTYLSNWINARDANNVVRGRMNVDGTVAGRFSSSGDAGNLQNIPERNGYGIKKAFVCADGRIKWAVDYGQLEARLAAWIAETILPEQGAYSIKRKYMTDLFNSGKDMHSYVRDVIGVREILYGNLTDSEILYTVNMNPEEMTEEEQHHYVNRDICRYAAKTLNFGLLYSGTKKMISKLLRIGLSPAQELEVKWRKMFPAFEKAQEYYETLAQTYRETPDGLSKAMYITQPITGRHRKFHLYDTWATYWDAEEERWKGFNPRQASARSGWNNVVQGLGGWMSVNSALRYYQDYTWEGLYPYAQIHDALDGDADVNELHRIKTLIGYMLDYPTNPLLTADLEAGYNWQPYNEKNNPMGMRKVDNIDLWVYSKGQEGYKQK